MELEESVEHVAVDKAAPRVDFRAEPRATVCVRGDRRACCESEYASALSGRSISVPALQMGSWRLNEVAITAGSR